MALTTECTRAPQVRVRYLGNSNQIRIDNWKRDVTRVHRLISVKTLFTHINNLIRLDIETRHKCYQRPTNIHTHTRTYIDKQYMQALVNTLHYTSSLDDLIYITSSQTLSSPPHFYLFDIVMTVCVCVCVYSFKLALLTVKSLVRQVVRLLGQWLKF